MSSSSPSHAAAPPGPAERPSKRSVSRKHRQSPVQLLLILSLTFSSSL